MTGAQYQPATPKSAGKGTQYIYQRLDFSGKNWQNRPYFTKKRLQKPDRFPFKNQHRRRPASKPRICYTTVPSLRFSLFLPKGLPLRLDRNKAPISGLEMHMVGSRSPTTRSIIKDNIFGQKRCQFQHIGKTTGYGLWGMYNRGKRKMAGKNRIRIDQ